MARPEDAAKCKSAHRLFQDIVESYGAASPPPAPYDRLGLLKLCGSHAVSSSCPCRLAEAVFEHAGIGVCADSIDRKTATAAARSFADHLVDNLFLPLRAIAQCRSVAVQDAEAGSGSDDEGAAAAGAGNRLYIFPPSPMTRVDEDGDQSESGALAASLLSLLQLIEDDAPRLLRQCEDTDANQITLDGTSDASSWLELFSRFQAVLGGTPPTLRRVDGDSTAASTAVHQRAGQPPIALLHFKIAHILNESGAGAYIDSILADTVVEDLDAAGGMSHLGRLMALRLEGWWDGGASRGRRGAAESMFWVESSSLVEE